jgi:hypothetical protein
MQDFIKDVMGKLGIDEGAANAATSGLLGLIKDNAEPDDVGEMFEKLPGAETLAAEAPKEESDKGGGGLLGGIGGAIGDALGGGSPLGALESLTKGGLSLDKIGDFVKQFVAFVKPKLGDDLLKKLLAKVPGIGSLLG